MKKIFTLSLFLFLGFSVFAQNIELSNKLIDRYNAEQQKASQKDASIHNHLWLTPILRDVFIHWNDLTVEAQSLFKKYRGRPTLTGTEQTKSSGNFVFHYSTDGGTGEKVPATDANANSIPDYVDNMMAKFNEIYTKYHTTNGYTVPPGDGTNGGDGKFDVYISGDEAGANVYGYVMGEDEIGDNPNSSSLTEGYAATSYMVMRNDYTGFGDLNTAISVTAAHEYMHAIQYGYDDGISFWFLEASATWAEDFIYPGYDDNLQYLKEVFRSPDIAINYEDGEARGAYDGHWYGVWLFVKYMTEHTNTAIIKSIFERCITQNTLDALNTELSANWSSNVSSMFEQFVISNALLSNNAGLAPYTYTRAATYKSAVNANGGLLFDNKKVPFSYNGTPINWNSETNGNNQLMRLSADYFSFTANKNFKITFTPIQATTEAKLYLIKATVTNVSVVSSDGNGVINVTDQSSWTQFIPVVIRFDNAVTDTVPLNYTLSVGDVVLGVDEKEAKYVVYPNPVGDYLNIETGASANWEAEIMDIAGKCLINQKFTGESNRMDVHSLAPGMYFIQISKDNGRVSREKVIITH